MTATNVVAHAFEPFRLRANALVYSSLPAHIERLQWDAEQVRTFQAERLRSLLAHAIDSSPFHAKRLGGVDPATFELDDLASLPVMTKTQLMDNFDDVVTDRRLHRADLEAIIAATGSEPISPLGEYLVLTSGGSSGNRGIFVMDAAAIAEFMAFNIRHASALSAGVPTEPGSIRAVMVAAGAPIHATAVGGQVLRGGPVTATSVPSTLPFAEIVARVQDVNPHLLMGYPSVIARLAHEQLAGRLDIDPFAVTCSAENLHAETRAVIERAFAPVSNLFGSTEGLIGLSPPGRDVLEFATDGCIVELVDEHDRPVEPGTTSASILVTNLYNRTQPLIRYRIEDRFTEQPATDGRGYLRATVDGRAADVLRWGDLVVHPLTVTNELLLTPAVVDYVVRQTPTGVDVDVVPTGAVDTREIGQRVAAALTAAGLEGAVANVGVIAEVVRNARTGKAARIVPL